jgi:carboxylate-amine ligase
LRPALEEHDEWDEVSSLARDVIERGTGAARQREAYARSGNLEGVVDFMVAETAKGTEDARRRVASS